jgi:hypothetical protein
MFGLDDFLVFFRAFFIVFPIVTLIHVFGHYLFARISGCHDVSIIIGCGKKLFTFRKVEVRKFYFWHGGCELSHINVNNKFRHLLIYFGGALFNILGILIVHMFIKLDLIEASNITYQFIYFSIYTVFFALIPMDYPDGSPSDGKAIIRIYRNKEVNQSTDCQNKEKSRT